MRSRRIGATARASASILWPRCCDRPDLIVSQGPIIFNIQRSQTSLPVLFAYSGDPVEARLVDSLARPGRNLSGISMMALELVGKRTEALAEAVPGLKKVAVISNPTHAGEQGEFKASQAAAVKLGAADRIPSFSERGRARCRIGRRAPFA